MSQELKGNWRSHSGYNFFSSLDFEDGQETTLTIKKVSMETANDPSTKKPKQLISINFNETNRLMALNKTNAKKITEITGTPKVDKWKGEKITLFKMPIRAFGKDQFCLRVK